MRNTSKILVFAILLSILGSACKNTNPNYQQDALNPELTHRSVRKITDIIVYDIFPPMIASRIYAYSTIAGYEAMRPGSLEYQSLATQLTGLEAVPKPDPSKTYCFPLASAQAMLMVGKKLTFSDDEMDKYIALVQSDFKKLNMPNDVFKNSIEYGEIVSKHILAWADKDNYKQMRTMPKYSINDNPATWKPTPPMYADALEPHWKKLRPFTLDSAAQFRPAPPQTFSTDKKSAFYKEALEVLNIVKGNDTLAHATALFWDDNAFAARVEGHVMMSSKKISPGGHWLNIAATAAKQSKLDAMRSMEMYVRLSIAIADGFISCWDEKYRSCLIRPETYITQYINHDFIPYIQTPPFPEHTSGHSVISGASATVLTNYFGDNYAFTDSTELIFGIPNRDFKSFQAAADQAAISRMYGGIHYRTGMTEGLKQGRRVGDYVLTKLQTKTKK